MTSPTWSRRIEEIADTIRNANGKCVVLIGAGCSQSAGIPLAKDLVKEVGKKFPAAHGRVPKADRSNYNKVMSALTITQRRGLLDPYIDAARINWAHLALAQLFATGKIERVLTVNFDPLLVRACAMVGVFPAIYDLVASNSFNKDRLAPRSLFYLNGQHTGFVTLNTEEELEGHRKRLKEIVDDTGTCRTWIVAGYSGEADPLLDVLAEREIFEGGLYWVGHDATPSPDLERKLLSAGKDAFYLGGQDADRFFTELAQRLGCFPPDLLVRPFSHVKTLVTTHIDFSTGGDTGRLYEEKLGHHIDKANTAMPEWEREAVVSKWLLAGDSKSLRDWYDKLTEPGEGDRIYGAWAYLDEGDSKADEAIAKANTDLTIARHLWASAREDYAQALEIQPTMYSAANNWCAMLVTQYHFLKPTSPAEAPPLLDQAEELARRAESLHPGAGTYNLACVLSLKGDRPAALDWLNKASAAGTLPDAPNLRTDPDLAPLRADPAFQAWWREVFGPDEPLDAPAA